jgi:hypothetical protein
MMSQRSFRRSLAFLLASGALLAPVSAWASNTCTASSDCPKGYSCQTTTIATPCPAIACAPGETCTQPVCEPETISQCTPLPCTSADDCAPGMVCFTQTTHDCPVQTAPACPRGADCAPPTPEPSPSCTSTSTSSCVPKYLLPCTSASDCGDGFTCVADEVGSCSGSAGVAPSEDGGPVELPAPPVCTTMTLSTSHCSAKEVSCTSAADCPSAWTCEDAPQDVSNIACGPQVSVDGGATMADCPLPTKQPAQKLCMPPYADLASSGAFGDANSLSGAGGSETSAPQSAAPGAQATGGDSSSDGGCAVGSGRGGNGALSLVGLAGLVGLARRRRAS